MDPEIEAENIQIKCQSKSQKQPPCIKDGTQSPMSVEKE